MLLRTRWASRAEAVTAIKLHSTMQNHRVMINTKKSNDRKLLLECWSKHGKVVAASSKSKGASSTSNGASSTSVDPRFVCDYSVRLRKSKAKGGERAAKPWGIVETTKSYDLLHSPNCRCPPSISTR